MLLKKNGNELINIMERTKIHNPSISPIRHYAINKCQKHFRRYSNNHLHKSVTKQHTEALLTIASAGYWHCDIGDNGILVPTAREVINNSQDEMFNKNYLRFNSKNNADCLCTGAGLPLLKLR